MGENPLIIKDRLGHEDIETTLGTYGHLYPNSNFEVANKLNGAISFKEAKQNYDTSPKNQFTVDYLRNKEMKKCNKSAVKIRRARNPWYKRISSSPTTTPTQLCLVVLM